ncbi:MAG: DNA polymerase III subunit alpha [Bacteroidales bacterium]
MSSFVHLHVHSYYSILDGQASIQSLVDKAIADKMPAIALTDHGNMFGAKDFVNYISKKNSKNPDNPFKPIIGCEVYVAQNGRLNKRKEDRSDLSGRHLILLAKNKKGYHNLVKLVSEAWVTGFYGRPRIDKELLEKYHEGLICCSACLGGEIPKLIQQERFEEAEKAALWYKNLFGDDYYLELQRHQTNDPNASREVFRIQQTVNPHLVALAKKIGVKVIATNDVHFANREDAEAHDHLICLNTGKDLDDPNRMRYTKQEWLKSCEEMNNIFADIPEAIANTLEIANKVEMYSIDSKAIMPDFPIPAEFSDADDYLRHLTYKGAETRYPDMSDDTRERIDFELETVKKMGFPGYFLIVQDFIAAARNMGVSVGPGRGSAAGSVVAYCLGITDIDPIRYDLLFERFLNPDRISMPDIDIDFDDDGRGEVLRYVTDKYGFDKVAHIVTFGTMATKSALKDVARVRKLPLPESDRLTKLVPDKIPNVKKVNLREAIKYVPELKAAAESDDPVLSNTLKYAQMLEGTVRNIGVHACGIIIGKDDLSNYVPISTADDKETGEKMLVTQYEGSVIEEVGMLKMDFLGLKNLSIIKECLENIRINTGEQIDISKISLEDKKTYELYSAGQTLGTFQFESAGMQKYLKELQPTTFEDLIAMNALYRPGPMDYIPSFIARKHGREEISYDIPEMERYLKDTYGITVYQEQVMLLSRQLGGFTRGQSDELRKAMGKKIQEKMDALKIKFMEGAAKNGHDTKVCEKIWGDWAKFAQYAFNKSHATCYSWVAYQTAYLKANYPSEYMAALLSRNLNDIKEVTKYMDECRAMGINVLGPDVNESMFKFAVNKRGDIRFGLGAVKGVGEGAVQAIVEERAKNGPFTGIFDFVERINLNACNRKAVESLALSGAFDGFGEVKRESFFVVNDKNEPFIDVIIRFGNKVQNDKSMNSNTLFGDAFQVEITRPSIPSSDSWSDLERLNKEKELVGFYISAHPLDKYEIILKHVCNTQMVALSDKSQLAGKSLLMGGIVTSLRTGMTKNGKPYEIIKIEDYSGSGEIALFGKDFIDYQKYFINGLSLLINARVEPRRFNPNELDLRIVSIELLEDAKEKAIERITIEIPEEQLETGVLSDLSAVMTASSGNHQVFFTILEEESGVPVTLKANSLRTKINRALIEEIESHDGCSFRIN